MIEEIHIGTFWVRMFPFSIGKGGLIVVAILGAQPFHSIMHGMGMHHAKPLHT